MTLEEFRALTPDQQNVHLAEQRNQLWRVLNNAAAEAIYESDLVPTIPTHKTADLPPIPNRDEAVRQLMRSDSSIREVQTAEGVVYRR